MTTNKTFLSSFFAAFKAQSSALPKAASPPTGAGAYHTTTTPPPHPHGSSSPSPSASSALSIPTKTGPLSPLPSPPVHSGSSIADAVSAAQGPGAGTTTTSANSGTVHVSGTATPMARTPFQSSRHHTAPYHARSTSPGLHSPPATRAAATTKAFPIPGAGVQKRERRGSDSSSEGFFDVVGGGRDAGGGNSGGDKWYIGGRTAAGEETFYRLGVVRRQRSGDRLSLDRLSI